ncbi:hypothetical protein SPWS13_0045 [Shewanella putrefaciens]|nr:hypothetical protein SPWS13_0045 [Shewanella putrefaciens]
MQDMPCPDGVAQSTIDVVIQNGQKKLTPSLMMRASLVIGKIS